MRTVFVTLFVALALTSTAQTPLIDQGRALLEKRDYEHATEVLEKAVAASPKNADAHYLLGAAYGEQAMTASVFSRVSLAGKAKDQFEAAVQADPNHLDARMALMQWYTVAPAMIGGSAAKAMEQAVEIKKHDAVRGAAAFAYIYNNDKKPELARKEYLDLVRQQPNSPKAHIGLATSYINEKNFDAAVHEAETAVKLDPSYLPGFFWVGRIAATAGTNYARGEEALKKYLGYTPKRDEPGLHRAHYWLGQIYEKTGRKAEAKASYETSLKLRPDQKDVNEALKRVS